jgi:hypothetical protein
MITRPNYTHLHQLHVFVCVLRLQAVDGAHLARDGRENLSQAAGLAHVQYTQMRLNETHSCAAVVAHLQAPVGESLPLYLFRELIEVFHICAAGVFARGPQQGVPVQREQLQPGHQQRRAHRGVAPEEVEGEVERSQQPDWTDITSEIICVIKDGR